MKLKEFFAGSLRECLEQVRSDLGPDAVILETKKMKTGGILGLRAKDSVRILAATGIAVTDSPNRTERRESAQVASPEPEIRAAVAARMVAERYAAASASSGQAREQRFAAVAPDPQELRYSPDAQRTIARLEDEMRALKQGFDVVRAAVQTRQAPTPVREPAAETPRIPAELEARLRAADLSETLLAALIRKLPDLSGWGPLAQTEVAENALRDLMAARVAVSGALDPVPGTRKVVALVGPTGVGKTTTIAKLAAQYAMQHKKRVGLLTMDTYRIAAVEQLRTYSQIVSLPLEVAHHKADLVKALDKFDDLDLVFIDTAGRSQKNTSQVEELRGLVETACCETHLVLAAGTKLRDMQDQVKRFSRVGVDRLLFSKLDETASYGTILSVAAESGIPVSYLTTGQKVPEDIEVADAMGLATTVMHGACVGV